MTSASAPFLYVIALGSNRVHPRHGRPETVVQAALACLAASGIQVLRAARSISSAPIGPSLRTYANSACLISTPLSPPRLLAHLKQIERAFGRRRGQRWGSRVLDCDIVLWSGGRWQSPALTIPHRLWRTRTFVAAPVAGVAPLWRDPVSGLTARQTAFRLKRPLAKTETSMFPR